MPNKAEILLSMVRGIRDGIKRSPGMSHAPFSDEGWAIVELALQSRPFDKKAADRMAEIVDEMVRARRLDPRSPLADARLDYGEPTRVVDVRCSWTPREGKPGVYDCPHCKSWTGNLPLYRNSVCEAKDRRRGTADRRQG